MEKNWRVGNVSLGKNGDTAHARVGFVDEQDVIALPPKALKRFATWADKMGISEQARNTFLSSVSK